MSAMRGPILAVGVLLLGCAGFAYGESLGGDTNGDCWVDLDDFIILKQNFGMLSGATKSQGDFDGDGDVDLNDFMILKANFGGMACRPPIADAGPNQVIADTDNDSKELVSLDGSGSYDPDGTITSYVWKEGATEIATGSNPIVVLNVGMHAINLNVTDDDATTDTDTAVIIVTGEGTQPGEDEPGFRELAFAQPSDGVFVTGEGEDGEDLTIQHYTDQYCLATGNSTYDLYVSTDGRHWTRERAPQGVDFTCVWGLPNGSILAIGNTGDSRNLFISTDSGESWRLCIAANGTGGDTPEFSSRAYFRAWSVAWTPDGSILLGGEYGSPSMGGG